MFLQDLHMMPLHILSHLDHLYDNRVDKECQTDRLTDFIKPVMVKFMCHSCKEQNGLCQ